jgi:prepilin-type N-terminal cleavage/methylation domain-containing protein
MEHVDYSMLKGLTLIEILVSIVILSSMLLLTFVVFNPYKNLEKVNDEEERQNLQQIKAALDTYYNDNNCYPTTIPFGSEWRVGSTVYMLKVPQSSACTSDVAECFIYQTNGSCPQWSILFTKLSKSQTGSACILNTLPSCKPLDFTDQWACIALGNIDCSYLSTIRLSDGSK